MSMRVPICIIRIEKISPRGLCAIKLSECNESRNYRFQNNCTRFNGKINWSIIRLFKSEKKTNKLFNFFLYLRGRAVLVHT